MKSDEIMIINDVIACFLFVMSVLPATVGNVYKDRGQRGESLYTLPSTAGNSGNTIQCTLPAIAGSTDVTNREHAITSLMIMISSLFNAKNEIYA